MIFLNNIFAAIMITSLIVLPTYLGHHYFNFVGLVFGMIFTILVFYGIHSDIEKR